MSLGIGDCRFGFYPCIFTLCECHILLIVILFPTSHLFFQCRGFVHSLILVFVSLSRNSVLDVTCLLQKTDPKVAIEFNDYLDTTF